MVDRQGVVAAPLYPYRRPPLSVVQASPVEAEDNQRET
jgi:hypothetical protein